MADLIQKHGLSYVVSKLLGFGSILGSCFYKLPIFLNIMKAKSCQGLSVISLYLEGSSYFANIIYNINRRNSFSSFGDLIIVWVQIFLMIALSWTLGFGEKQISASHKILVSFGFLLYFYTVVFLIPVALTPYLIIYSITVSMLSKLPQIYQNYRDKSTGVQSSITAANAMFGPVVKIYIALAETGDHLMMIYSVVLFSLNFILFSQILLYQKPKQE
jgi:mannose-P-dolichol utilization defect protein 1